jgi:hypothetical protein
MMDNQIFNLGLSVYAYSLYIVVCSLADEGSSPTPEALRGRWNASEELLNRAIEELEAFKVIEKLVGPKEIGQVFVPNPASMWRTPWAADD